MSKKVALGRGLDALLARTQPKTPASSPSRPSTPPTPPESDEERLVEVPLGELKANPDQPRGVFDETKIKELAQSIKEQGLIQPISVRRIGQDYQLITG